MKTGDWKMVWMVSSPENGDVVEIAPTGKIRYTAQSLTDAMRQRAQRFARVYSLNFRDFFRYKETAEGKVVDIWNPTGR